MRQVPHYTIIGSGRLATHFATYFLALRLPFDQWSRKDPEHHLASACQTSTHILLLISDDAIENFFHTTLKPVLQDQTVVHCSALIDVSGVNFAHPLMTFGPDPYPLSSYQEIPFIISNEGPCLANLLPGLCNPSVRISPEMRSKYHAYCVMSGNFTSIIWSLIRQRMQQEIGIDPSLMHPYLQQTCTNIIKSDRPLTGPFVRNDQKTIKQHQQCLKNTAWQTLYDTMYEIYLREYHDH